MNTYDIYRLETPEQVVSHQQANSPEEALEKEARSARTACSTPRYSRFSTGMGPMGPASPERNAVAEHSYPHNSIPQAQPTNKPNKKGSEENASPQEP